MSNDSMKAVIYAGDGTVRVEDIARPTLQESTDAIVKVEVAGICGSDLHLLAGRIPGMEEGSGLGHEFAGEVVSVGDDVSRVAAGDKVVGAFIVPCGECWFCKAREFGRCGEQRVFGYGSFFGDLGGAQAQYVRVPSADLILRKAPATAPLERMMFAGDVFTTGYECAAEGKIRRGDTVAVIGLGPVGLTAVSAALSFEPAQLFAIDMVESRRAMATKLGATALDPDAVNPAAFVQDATGGRGADVVLEAVGASPALDLALEMVRSGGRISVIGVHADFTYEMPLNLTFLRAIDLKFCGLSNIVGRWDAAAKLLEEGKATPEAMVTHRLPLEEAVQGYDLFSRRKALKVLLLP